MIGSAAGLSGAGAATGGVDGAAEGVGSAVPSFSVLTALFSSSHTASVKLAIRPGRTFDVPHKFLGKAFPMTRQSTVSRTCASSPFFISGIPGASARRSPTCGAVPVAP
ncbi:hypothetical protein GCM10017778_50750 [Streptomyces vinaceus]|nr:hypothetical protein GCM10017778_50750 [Streptomyces vinaceus]